ncbi:MAG: ribose-phosphate diphosphokinase [Desulfurococcus sp.]|nr:ribose-phosphate diphosphokinase [Desulfurococcus sp.]
MLKALVLGNYSEGVRIARSLGVEVVGLTEKFFPDGEQYLRINEPREVDGEVVLVISTMYPMQDQAFTKLLIAADAVARSNASEVVGVVPYIAYSRQDKEFMPGEPVSALVVLNALKTAGYSKIFTVDFHSNSLLSLTQSFLVNIHISDLLVKALAEVVENPVVIAPDKGALERARLAAESISADYDHLVKLRDKVSGEVSYTPREVSVNGRDVILVDDIISTGGTIAEASRILLAQGARRIYVAASHGLLVGDALTRIANAGVKRIVLANTLGVRIQDPLVQYIDVSDRIAAVIREVLGV